MLLLSGAAANATDGVPAAMQPRQEAETSTATRLAQGNSCANACQAEHDRCRVQRKGSPSCDAERQACLQKCLEQRKR
jgi:hypothetical protein